MSRLNDSIKAIAAANPTPFLHVESELAELLGVAQDVLKAQRKALLLTRGADWDLVKNAVTYTEAAAKKILAALQAGSPPAEPAAVDPATIGEPAEPPALPEKAAPAIVDALCAKLPRNRRIIIARLGAGREAPLVRVRVKDSSNFRVGMELKARHLAADLYELEGKAPRFPGKF